MVLAENANFEATSDRFKNCKTTKTTMSKYFKKKKEGSKDIARQHILELMEEAEKSAVKRPELAKRYVVMARKISSRLKVPIPNNLKRRFCKGCGAYFTSKNSRIRLNKGKKTYTCLTCQSLKRVPYRA